MIANFVTILIGLWLAYRAIFSLPAGNVNQIELVVAGVALILLALWARRTDFMSWYSGTNIVLAVIILLLAAAHRVVGVDPLVSFWMILLIGITAAITARLSLYVWHVAVPQQSTEKNHRPVCRVDCLGLLCSTSHLALRGMDHAQDFTGCSADSDACPRSDEFARG